MKIGIVTPGGFDRSGTERVIPTFLWLVERLARHHEVHVFTLNQYPHPDEYPLLGATVHNIGYREGRRRNSAQIPATLAAIHREHRRGRFDVLHGLWASQSGFITALAGKLLHVPTAVTVAGGELTALPEIGYGEALHLRGRWKVEMALRMAGTITCAAEYTRSRLLSRYPDTRLIVLGVDTAQFTPPETQPPSPPWNLLHVASLNRVKDQPTLLRAFQGIHNAEPATHLNIIGEDTLHGEIQRLAQDLGLADAVTFHGFQPSHIVAQKMREAHLLLLSSLSDAAPMVILEAAASGVPTVGTAVGLMDALAPYGAASVPCGDYKTLASVALALIRDEASRLALGQHALTYARTYNADWTASQFTSVYQELAARGAVKRVALAHGA